MRAVLFVVLVGWPGSPATWLLSLVEPVGPVLA